MKQQHSASASAKPATPRKSAAPRKPSARTNVSPAEPDGPDREQMVREAAYYYYEARGYVDGHQVEDWLKAEADIERAFGGGVDETAKH